MSDALWERLEVLLPERAAPFHPLGRHRQRVPDRKVLNSIFSLLRTGGQWQSLNLLDSTRYAKRSTAHARFQEWTEAGFFARLWEASLLDYDEMHGLDFEWMALDGAMTKAPLGGEKSGPCPCDRGKGGVKRSPLTEASGVVVGLVVEGANRHDMTLVRQTLESVPAIIAAKRDEFLFGPLEVEGVDLEAELARVREPEWEPDLEAPVPESGLCLDAGFDYDEVREVAAELGYTTHPPRGHPLAGRGETGLPSRTKGAALGGRAHPLVAQSLPTPPDPMGQKGSQRPRLAPFCLCPLDLE